MKIFEKFKNLFVSNENSLEDEAIESKNSLENEFTNLQTEFNKTTALVSTTIASKSVLEKKYNDAIKEVNEWQEKAILATKRNDDELAKKAIEKRLVAEKTRDDIKKQLDIQTSHVEYLKENLKSLKEKIDEMNTRKQNAINKMDTAIAKQKLTENINSFNNELNLKDSLDDAEIITAKAEAYVELSKTTSDKELESLKNKYSDTNK